MRNDPGGIIRVSKMVGDTIAVVASFIGGYLVRVVLDARPFYFEVDLKEFFIAALITLPLWLFILAALGLYDTSHKLSRLSELFRLGVASVVGVICMVAMNFFLEVNLFPSRMVAVYAILICFGLLVFERSLIRVVAPKIFRQPKAIVVGKGPAVTRIITSIASSNEYELAAIVAPVKLIPEEYRGLRQSSVRRALSRVELDAVFHAGAEQAEYLYKQCVEHHLMYHFVPPAATLTQHIGQVRLLGITPTISLAVTPLLSGNRMMKRLFDIVAGVILLVLASPAMFVIYVIIKLGNVRAQAVYGQERLTAFKKKVKIYKFRTMKPEYSGQTPESAFRKMEKEGKILSAKFFVKDYRRNGDYLEFDPRVTKFGKFLRQTSLDELPQLINVIRGDISLVGPRALVPGELKKYGDKAVLLSVKSGLTGLAQVSGRRELSFTERRALDLYYIRNWTLSMDVEILARTIIAVVRRKGAR